MNKRQKGNWEQVIDQFDPDYFLVLEASPLPNKVFTTEELYKSLIDIKIHKVPKLSDHDLIIADFKF